MFDTTIFLAALASSALLKGAMLTIVLSVCVQACTMLLAMPAAVLVRSKRRRFRWPVVAYVWLFRAAPALLILLIVWNGLPQFMPAFRSQWFTPFMAAFIALSLIQTAYATEIMRGALAAVSVGQAEAASALGFNRLQTYLLIILPQALRIALPMLVNEFIALLKATSLATVISLKELMTITQYAVATSFRFLEWYTAALIYYLIMVACLTSLQMRIERRLSLGFR